jgi:hypothetical protein
MHGKFAAGKHLLSGEYVLPSGELRMAAAAAGQQRLGFWRACMHDSCLLVAPAVQEYVLPSGELRMAAAAAADVAMSNRALSQGLPEWGPSDRALVAGVQYCCVHWRGCPRPYLKVTSYIACTPCNTSSSVT